MNIFSFNKTPLPLNTPSNPPSNSWRTALLQHLGRMVSIFDRSLQLFSQFPEQPANLEPEENIFSSPLPRRRVNPESSTPTTIETEGNASSVKLEYLQNLEDFRVNSSLDDALKDSNREPNRRNNSVHEEILRERPEVIKQEETIREFNPIKAVVPEKKDWRLDELVTSPAVGTILEQQFDQYLAIWETLHVINKKKRPLTCNTWLLEVEHVKDGVTLKDLEESLESKLNKNMREKIMTRKMESEHLSKQEENIDDNSGFPGRNVVFWAVEGKNENKQGRKWDVYLIFKTQVSNGYSSTKWMKDAVRMFRKKGSRDAMCKFQANFKEGLQSIFKESPSEENYITNDFMFEHNFVALFADKYWKNSVSAKNTEQKIEKPVTDPRVEYTCVLEKFIQNEAVKYDAWEKLEMKVLTDPMLCHLFGTLISQRPYFKSKFEERKKALRSDYSKNQPDVIIVEDEEDIKKMKSTWGMRALAKNEGRKMKVDTSDVDMYFSGFERYEDS